MILYKNVLISQWFTCIRVLIIECFTYARVLTNYVVLYAGLSLACTL